MKNQIMTMEMVNDGQHITSLEIAKLVGKAHYHVMRDIRNMEPGWEEVHKIQIWIDANSAGNLQRRLPFTVHFAVRSSGNRRKISILNG